MSVKKWGYWGFAVSSIVAFSVNLASGLGVGQSLLGLLGLALLYGVLQIGKENAGWSQLESSSARVPHPITPKEERGDREQAMNGASSHKASAQENDRVPLIPTATSTDFPSFLWSLIFIGAGLGYLGWFANSSTAWTIGVVAVALLCCLVLLDVHKWTRARSLRRCLGEPLVTSSSHSIRIGHTFDIHLTLPVKSPLLVKELTLRLHCDTTRTVTFGSRDREKKVWGNLLRIELDAMHDLRVEANSAITMKAQAHIPLRSYCTSADTRWWIVLEAAIQNKPKYCSDFAIEVKKGPGVAAKPQTTQ